MMARFDDSGRCVEVYDVLIGCGISKEESREVVMVKFTTSCTRALDTHMRTKCLKMCNVGLLAVPTFVRSLMGFGVHKSVMEVYGVEESGGPELLGEARTVEESTNFNCQGVVVNLGTAILGRAIRTCAFNNLAKIFEHSRAERVTSCEFAPLVCTDNSVTCTILQHERTKDGNGRFL